MSIEAMKQALEALERLKSYGNIFMYRKTERNPYDQAVESITALRQAIEQAEKQEPVIGTKTWFEDGKMVTQHLHPSDIYASDISAKRVDETAKDLHEPESNDVEAAAEQSDNYAAFLAGVRFARVNLPATPKREWVGLTQAEFEETVDGLEDLIDCWQAIEAKLKEKNNG